MYAKKVMAALLLTTALAVTACGKATETVEDGSAEQSSAEVQSGSTGEEFQSAEAGTEDSEGEDSQPEEEAAEEASVSYIFSHMPIAAYEVTGLGVGHFESVNDENIIDEDGNDYGVIPLIRLTPGENTFVLFCIPGNVGVALNEYGYEDNIGANIHSSSGSGKWEANTYDCSDFVIPEIEGFSLLKRNDYFVYDEETYDGRTESLVDPWLNWIRFAEIYHPDAQKEDTIYVIEVEASGSEEDGFDQMENVLASMKTAFEELGATSVKEIPVEEALERCKAVVSEGDAN